jgi:hypothetical protein
MTSPDTKQLIERLRARDKDAKFRAGFAYDVTGGAPKTTIYSEAADEIERLSALQQPDERDEEIARLRADILAMKGEIEALCHDMTRYMDIANKAVNEVAAKDARIAKLRSTCIRWKKRRRWFCGRFRLTPIVSGAGHSSPPATVLPPPFALFGALPCWRGRMPTDHSHAPKMISPKHFNGTVCGAKGPITVNRPTCPECLDRMQNHAPPK